MGSLESRITAKWIWTEADQPPLENATLIMSDGLLLDIYNGVDATAQNLGPVAIIPGLINAHTHLEFSGQPFPTTPIEPFADWIRGVVAQRRQAPADYPREALAAGLGELRTSGTIGFGEIVTYDLSRADLGEVVSPCTNNPTAKIEGRFFREVFTLKPENISAQMALAQKHLQVAQELGLAAGLSPHAPYTVHPQLFSEVIALAKGEGVPVAMHLAETQDELQLLTEGTGSLAQLLQDFDLWPNGVFGNRTVRTELEGLAQCVSGLVIHGNYLTPDELKWIAEQPNLTLVYCPRTHAGFGHRDHPWRRLIELGGRVALGTDSRASNPDLSILRELQFLQAAHPDLSPLDLLPLATTIAGSALELKNCSGRLIRGEPFLATLVRSPSHSLEQDWTNLLSADNEACLLIPS
jgi:aminodeoxyfutalosine deaminase